MKHLLAIILLFQLYQLSAQDSLDSSLVMTSQKSQSTEKITIEDNINIDSTFVKQLDALHRDVKKINEHVNSKSNIKDYIPILVALLAGLLALFQVKANIISSARIEWTQNLRKVVSQYLSEMMILNYNLREVLELNKKGKKKKAKDLYDRQTESFKKVYEYGNQIKLFLNNKKETDHSELQKSIEQYFEKATHGKSSNDLDELDKMQNEIISKSQEILKQAWEDAKTFKVKDIFKFSLK